MKFLVPRDPLAPRALEPVKPMAEAKVLRAGEYAAWREAGDLVAAAREQAARILAGSQEAFDKECRRGFEHGERQAKQAQAEAMIEIIGRKVDYLESVEHDAIDLVMGAVRKVVDGFDDEAKVAAVTRNALAVLRNQKQITLRLHPDELDHAKANMTQFLAAFPGIGFIDLVADARLAAGSCILESGIGIVEASLEDQIAALDAAFKRVLGNRKS